LLRRGLSIVDDPKQADYLVVNTCGFIQSAKEESIEEILKLADLKNSNGRKHRLLITGCLAQRYPSELLRQIPEIDGMLGIDQYDKIDSLLDADSAYITRPPSSYKESHSLQVLRDRPFAYLKIADGCDNRCSYCAIPMIRGKYRSRSLAAISDDVDRLLEHGVRELNLIAQDVARYGLDIGKHPLALLEMLEQKPSEFWVRPFYLHPAHLTDEILDFFGASKKFCQYLEIPLQHVNSRLLKEMNRRYSRARIEKLLSSIRVKLPAAVLRTTFIVGFPGETHKEFDELCSFVEEERICRGGVFGYSREEGTAAHQFNGRHAQRTIAARQEELTRLINENAEEFNASLVGRELKMIVERFDAPSKQAIGRLFCDAPEIDFTIHVPARAVVGKGFRTVYVTGTSGEGFVGEFVGAGVEGRKHGK
jgi:ribosomal protein S12 methylthiotransferase